MNAKCPSCGFNNLAGSERCEQCLHSLMHTHIPVPKKDDKIQRSLMLDPVGILLTGKDLLVANMTDSVQKVVEIFQKDKKHCILVYDHKHLVGILSNRDLLLKVAGKYKDLSQVQISAVMTTRPEFVKADDPIAFAVHKMALGGFRHLPVLAEDGTPISIVTIKDVLSFLSGKKDKPASAA